MRKIKLAGFYSRPVLTGLILLCGFVISYAQTTTNIATEKALISILKTAKDQTLPYGPKTVADDMVHKIDVASLSKKLNGWNADLFVDYDDSRRIKINVAPPLHRLWLKSGANASQSIKEYPGPVEFGALRLAKETRFELYSLMAYEQLDCNNCEYGLYQAVNILVTISNGRMLDHMTAAFNFGNSLGYEHRYLYLHTLKRIYTVDLVSDEEGAEVRSIQTWSIDSSGHFIKNIKK